MNKRATISPVPISAEARVFLSLLGVFIADYPEKIRQLLRDFGIATHSSIDGKELSRKVMYAITGKGRKFHVALSRLLSAPFPQEDHYLYEDNYVDLIMGAVGSIADMAGKLKSSRQIKAEGSNQTLASMLAYQQEKQELEAMKIAQKEKNEANVKLLKTGGLVLGVIVVGLAFQKPIKAALMPQAITPITN